MHDFRAKLSDPRISAAVAQYLVGARRRRGLANPEEPLPRDGIFAPISINLDLTLACDFACGHCIDSELLNDGRKLDFSVIADSLATLAESGLRSVILIGGGEPTLHPDFENAVVLIKRLGLECAIASNGAHNDRIARVAPLLGSKDWVRLSLDAGSEETFQALHRPRKAITLERICRGARAIKDAAPAVQLGFSFVVMWRSSGQMLAPARTNVREMPAAAKLARSYGFDYISFKPMLARSALRAEVVNIGDPSEEREALAEIRESLAAARGEAGPGFRVVPSTNLLALLDGKTGEKTALQPAECHMQQFRRILTPDGIFACPAHRGNWRSQLAGPSGYSCRDSLRQTMRAAESQIERFDASVECREVTCIYNEANWWLEDLIRDGRTPRPVEAGDFFL